MKNIDFDGLGGVGGLECFETSNLGFRDKPRARKEKVKSVLIERVLRTVKRRAFSEAKLLELFGEELSIGSSYHVISGGDIDSLSFLKIVLDKQNLDYCLFSTWCMAMDDVLQVKDWLMSGKIKRIDAYVGEIFPNSYKNQHIELKRIIKGCGGRVCVFRNHAKIFAGYGQKFSFAIESSANINTNPRTENTCVSIDAELYHFYKDFFDGIKSFNRDFDDWSKYSGKKG